ncbi:ribosomal RNA small subunit methyltransferase H [Nematostella vectensis]|uniref:ribosomal RNA small subunit methyltransferase H n=1 Tax=Nematostella vectensis TaxID=45351 RepID=UPI002076D65A|nr:ribosomal RNA small subunit methyltransferase H [Nematostella vectensis]
MAAGSLLTQFGRIFFIFSRRKRRFLSTQAETHTLHIPVMSRECLGFLAPKDGEVFVDATFGAGGHTCAILNSAKCKVFAVDRDPVAVEIAQVLSTRPEYKGQLIPLQGKFSDLFELLSNNGIKKESLDGMLLDIGPSSMQFDDPLRGFSLSKDGPLDMRMDSENDTKSSRNSSFTAADVVNSISERELISVLRHYGGERDAARISRAVIKARDREHIMTTRQLAAIVANAVGFGRKDKLNRFAHPATKTFQALRILVNDELNELHKALKAAKKLLTPGGRLVVISFHSAEDSIVKHFLKDEATRKTSKTMSDSDSITWLPLHKKVVSPSDDEIFFNPRCRSAKLRAVVKTNKEVLELCQLTHLLSKSASESMTKEPNL